MGINLGLERLQLRLLLDDLALIHLFDQGVDITQHPVEPVGELPDLIRRRAGDGHLQIPVLNHHHRLVQMSNPLDEGAGEQGNNEQQDHQTDGND
ncbi:hypothetical protein D3C71_1974070 [compost metagenome]